MAGMLSRDPSMAPGVPWGVAAPAPPAPPAKARASTPPSPTPLRFFSMPSSRLFFRSCTVWVSRRRLISLMSVPLLFTTCLEDMAWWGLGGKGWEGWRGVSWRGSARVMHCTHSGDLVRKASKHADGPHTHWLVL